MNALAPCDRDIYQSGETCTIPCLEGYEFKNQINNESEVICNYGMWSSRECESLEECESEASRAECTDIDECADDSVHQCPSDCVNLPFTYYCSCQGMVDSLVKDGTIPSPPPRQFKFIELFTQQLLWSCPCDKKSKDLVGDLTLALRDSAQYGPDGNPIHASQVELLRVCCSDDSDSLSAVLKLRRASGSER